jgi:hypothetical protein
MALFIVVGLLGAWSVVELLRRGYAAFLRWLGVTPKSNEEHFADMLVALTKASFFVKGQDPYLYESDKLSALVTRTAEMDNFPYAVMNSGMMVLTHTALLQQTWHDRKRLLEDLIRKPSPFYLYCPTSDKYIGFN